MRNSCTKMNRPILVAVAAILLAASSISTVSAQDKRVSQNDGVENTKMGAYRALAQHIYFEYQRGDVAAAAELSRVLERVWDKSEDYGGDTALRKTHPDLFDEIDKSMDDFLTPLMGYRSKAPEAAMVKAAYNTYLEKLKLAN